MGALIKDSGGRLLLIQRGHEPGKGLWSVPGGRIEDGESDAEALVREVREETGLIVAPGRLAGSIQRGAYDIRDYYATVTGGVLAAGDDADAAAWVSTRAMGTLPLTEGLMETLRSWGAV